MARRIRKGDTVTVIAGKNKGATGKVIEVLVAKDRVRVEGVNLIKRHVRPGANPKVPEGGIIDEFGTIHISNVQPIDPQSGKGTRIGFKRLDDGRKVRVAKRSGEVID